MNRVLVYGFKAAPYGGIERVLSEYIQAMTDIHDDITFDVLIVGDSSDFDAYFSGMGCRIIYLPSRVKSYRKYRAKLMSVFRENRYAAVWCNVSGLTNIDVLKLAKRFEIPVRVIHSHVTNLMWGNTFAQCAGTVVHYLNKAVLTRYANRYWACSESAGEFMYPSGVHDRIFVVKNAVSTQVHHPNRAAGTMLREKLDCRGLVISHVARMSPEKNQRFLLYVMRKIVDREPSAKLLLIGDGNLNAELKAVAKELKLEGNVIFLGFKMDNARYLQASDVFVLPSLTEGLGLSAIEAQACGVPCVVSDAVPREVDITGAVTFVPLDDPAEQWADAILKSAGSYIEDPKQCLADSGYLISAAAEDVYRILIGE